MSAPTDRTPRPGLRTLVSSLVLASALGGCVRSAGGVEALPPLPPLSIRADTVRVDTIADGVLHRFYYRAEGPWAIQVLDIDRARCWNAVALKAGGGAVGRARTSELIQQFAESPAARGRAPVLGGVNADFFSFTPPGVPTGAHVSHGHVITGPVDRPVFAVDSGGKPWIGVLRADGRVIAGGDTLPLASWNRGSTFRLSLFDRGWGARTDTATGAVEAVIDDEGRVVAVDTLSSGVDIPAPGVVVVAPRGADRAFVARLRALGEAGSHVASDVGLEPLHPREAVGGFPVLLRAGQGSPDLDKQGGPNFGPVRHPRTVVGIGSGGRRLLLVVVDGRQPGYSAGMTLRELAQLMRELGADEALNLDGGGSSTLVARAGRRDASFRVVNRPSDREGERPVANALAIARDIGCAR